MNDRGRWFRLLGHRVTLKVQDPGGWAKEGIGRSSIGNSEILLNSAFPSDVQGSTFMHELIHMISDHCSQGMTEAQVSVVASALYSWMRDNPEMVKSVAAGEELVS